VFGLDARDAMPPVLGFCGAAGSGKTTLLCEVVARLTGLGLKVGAIKHHGHPEPLPLDQPGKDTARLHEAGASRVLLVHAGGVNLVTRPHEGQDDPLLLAGRYLAGLDLVLVEGFKRAELDKIEVVVPDSGPLLPAGGRLIALARRGGGQREAGLPVLDADDPAAVARFVLDHLGLTPRITGHAPEAPPVAVLVDGRPLTNKPFVARLVEATIRSLVGGLKGGEEAETGIIEVRLG
jgi:molybdopterin-guanine dinucleotide biosynthesis protein MobB